MLNTRKQSRSFTEILQEGPGNNPNYDSLVSNEIYVRVRNFRADDQAELVEALSLCNQYLIAKHLIDSIRGLCGECKTHHSNYSSDENILHELRCKVAFLKQHLYRVKSFSSGSACREEVQKFRRDVSDDYGQCIAEAEQLLKPLPSAAPSMPAQVVTAAPFRRTMWQSWVNFFYPAENHPVEVSASRTISPPVDAGIATNIRTPVFY
jgi:hypothetical protein